MHEKSVYLWLCCLAAIVRGSSILEKYVKSPGNSYHGRYTRDIHEAELLVPRHVRDDGKFSTYQLPKYYNRRELSERSKRSSDSTADILHLLLPFNGIDHHVELSPYHEFISPELVIESRDPSKDMNEGLRFSRASDDQCHYRGSIRGHTNSRAALSLCNGVAGYIQTNEGRYFIEPISEAEPASDGQHVHMAYRREAPHEKTENGSLPGTGPKRRCGTGDNWEAAWAEQLVKRQQRLAERDETQPVDAAMSTGPFKRAGTKVVSGTHSIHRFIEIGLVCDRKFLDYYKGTDYEKYLLTVMNMVSDFYHDASSGNQIDVVVVRIIYLEKEKKEIDLSISPKAEITLESFAKWSDKMNPKDHKHPNHHDIAVLITRYDICAEDSGCDLMGLAYVAAACDASKAACINEDSGLLLGIVVAHEVGHVMGCSHDEIENSGCPPQDKDESYFIMSPIVFIYTIRWSSCSRKFITTFLESGLGECLNDDPRSPSDKYRYANMLPGAMYDADAQCSFARPGARYCNVGKDTCKQLWCKEPKGSKCFSNGAPAADGTKCGEKKWCIRNNCVKMGSRPAAVHGGWGAWGPMSSCSRTCGAGVKSAERECNKPAPSNGGRYCIGERRRLTTCNTTPCSPTKPPYRAVQCSEFDKKAITTDNVKHKWTPYLSDDLEPCALYCINEKNTFMKLANAVKDATPCKGGTNYMCISGACRKVGCDWVIDSDAVDDQCGVCKGDGTLCSPVEGVFTATKLRDYQKVVTVPKGARTITVEERKPSGNTLAVKLEKGNKYCLNKDHVEERNGDYPCAGAVMIYSHPEPQKEELTIRGPLTEDIQIQYCFYDPNSNPGISYKYYVKSSSGASAGYKPKYIWDFTEWSECSAKCGGGTSVSNPTCIEEKNGAVTPSYCQSLPRPDSKSRICNTTPCPAKWRVSEWSQCSACDKKSGVKHRKVQCVKPSAKRGGDDVQTNLKQCKGKPPTQTEKCVGNRPCKKTCPKRSGSCAAEEVFVDPRERETSLMKQRRMIDNFVDLGLMRYLEKRRRQTAGDFLKTSWKRDIPDIRNFLRDWAMMSNEETIERNEKRTCNEIPNKVSLMSSGKVLESGNEDIEQQMAAKGVTMPKPGSIIKDVVPPHEAVLYEAPMRDELVKANVSDVGFQESGDAIPVALDLSQEKVFHGAVAHNMQLGQGNGTTKKVSLEDLGTTDSYTTTVITDKPST